MLRTLLKGNKKSLNDYLPYIEFPYSRVVHMDIRISPFEVVYDFNPLIPLYLILFSKVF